MCETLAGNPCYLLTITSDVRKNDILLGRASEDEKKPTEPQTAKLKGSSFLNLNNATIKQPNSAQPKFEEQNPGSSKNAKEEGEKAGEDSKSYHDSSFFMPTKDSDETTKSKRK